MKKIIFIFAIASAVLACNSAETPTDNAQESPTTISPTVPEPIMPTDSNTVKAETAVYQCPMKCEKDKTYEAAGICPVCKMDLAKQ